MKIRKHIDHCSIGDVIGQDVYSDNFNFPIVKKGVIINEIIIDKIKLNNVSYIYIDERSDENKSISIDSSDKTLHFTEEYEYELNKFKGIFKDIASGKTASIKDIEDMTKNLIHSSTDVFRFIDSVEFLKSLDEYTYSHSINVALYSMLIAKWLKLSESQIQDVVKTGLLHDIGKSNISGELLNKEKPLSKSDIEELRKHSVYGYEVCDNIDGIDSSVKEGVLLHHEKVDGSGYPMGVKGEDINIYAKIVALAEVYDSATSNRVYAKKKTPFEVFREIKYDGFSRFDIEVMDAFLSNIPNFYIGSKVKLSNGKIGTIAFIPPNSIDTPIVKVGNEFYNTNVCGDLKIIEII